MNPFGAYMNWLHTRWPAGTVEKMPEVGEDGVTAIPGVRVVGDLTGIPLLKFSADTGARAVQAILKESDFSKGGSDPELKDLVIIGAGVSGISAALEAQEHGLDYVIYEAAEAFNTIVNFPKGKPIFTYPTDMVPAGKVRFHAEVKEALLEELEAQRTAAGVEPVPKRIEKVERKGGELHVVHPKGEAVTRAKRVIVAIGRSGNYRKLGVPGQDKDKVYHRLYDPTDYDGKDVLVVGGGDSALESAIALACSGARVTLSYRKKEFSRPKPDNIERLEQLSKDPSAAVGIDMPSSDRVTTAMMPSMRKEGMGEGHVTMMMASQLKEVKDDAITIQDADGEVKELPNDVVFAMIGREPPLDFFRRSGIPITGEWRASTWAGFIAFFSFCIWMYHWKSGSGAIYSYFADNGLFPHNMGAFMKQTFGGADDPSTLAGTLAITLKKPGFYYTVAYCTCVVVFGIDRMRRRRTPYVRLQTLSLMFFQVVPLCLMPYILLPLMGHNGWFDDGFMKTAADNLFPAVNYDHGREYWRAFGLVLAWPLFVWNFFTEQPMMWWLVIGGVQTFVIIPLMIYFFGKGAYCGWICSCGALAETLGDRHRQKMPHGPLWNRLNMTGQVILGIAFVLFIARILSWVYPDSAFGQGAAEFHRNLLGGWGIFNYKYLVDLWIAGVVGVGLYFWFSGRVWCRFACPLAALMHIYARFSKFRIFPEKKKCISCNVCTSVCHQGIDIMNFANKGLPMEDPECVRCSACVQMCPTGVLSFGRYSGSDGLIKLDSLEASAARARENAGG